MNNLITIVIPFYSNLNWLNEALRSVEKQTYNNYEVIIVDDGSGLDLDKFNKKYKIIKLNENKGVSIARNEGINNAKGKYIAFLDSDDKWDKYKLEKQYKYMEKNQSIWSHTSYEYFGDSNKVVNNKEFQGNIFPACIFSCNIATPTIMVRNEIFEIENYKFPENIKYGEDTITWSNIAMKYNIDHINEPLSFIRDRSFNAKSDIYKQLKSKKYFYEFLCNNKELIKLKKLDYLSLIYSFKLSNIKIQMLAKILYVPAYLYFKLSKIYYLRRKK